jgi:signal transduction histidine kinase
MEEVVARSRARNLAVSGVVLFLLAISSGLLVVAARRAERLAAQQMELVAGVTHELNTPIAALCSAGQNLADGVVSDEAQVRKYGEMITREGRRLSSMVAQMLQFAGIQSGERAVQTRRSRLEPIIDAAIADLAWLLGESGVHVETDVAAGLPDVEADPDALTRAISNLVSNAVKYRGTSTTVRVVASRDSRVGWVRIDVEDRGIGIASSDLANVFEPFYRGRSPEIATIRGSGLGLSIVRQVVREHGGTVDVVSAPGKGSTFSIRIPAYGTQGGGR